MHVYEFLCPEYINQGHIVLPGMFVFMFVSNFNLRFKLTFHQKLDIAPVGRLFIMTSKSNGQSDGCVTVMSLSNDVEKS